MKNKAQTMDFIKKYAMIIVLALVVIFFTIMTGGNILRPMNISSLISQNAYVFILATGMLLCILTGGNIDLSVGSVVCFVGAVGAELMMTFHVNIYLTILIMFVLGTAIGAFQAFWIAFVRIPPFIVTLAGMLVFRGLSNVVLDGLTVSIADKEDFVYIFGGGANCYIPDAFGVDGINLTCLLVAVVMAVIFLVVQLRKRNIRIGKGFDVEKAVPFYVKNVVIAIVIVAFGTGLALHKGIPTVLIWLAVVILVYHYITSNTRVGRYFYAVGGNEKATKLSG
ncbi:MAG: sugar ABC transporter permease, partial [Lachnospiraceae bacterium]|nr:sugar ABC transporter permease [Lachnospiraceae bacterium]